MVKIAVLGYGTVGSGVVEGAEYQSRQYREESRRGY